MSTPDQVSTALAKTGETKSLKQLIEESARELSRALPDHMKPERLVRIALTCIRTTPDLAKCTQESFLGALFTAAQLGIEPIAGRAYLLPFNNSRKKPDGTWHTVKEAQFLLGYRGVTELFYRHDKAINIEWGVVCEGDEFDYEKGTNSFLRHKEGLKRGAHLGYWVMANLNNGGKPFHYMTQADCIEHGKRHSKTVDKKSGAFYDSSPWSKDIDSMCLKTVLIQLAKILPLSVELQRSIQADETSREYRKEVENVLDLPDQVNWNDVEKEVEEKTKKELDNEKTV